MATKANIIVDQGTTFTTQILLTDENGDALNLTNFTGKSQIRKWYTSNSNTDFTVVLANGVITLMLSANTTGNLVSGRYVYDVIVTDPSSVTTRVVEGILTVTPMVSK